MDGPAAAVSGPRAAARRRNFSDRIGERMRSRLFEMCRVVNVNAPDYRQKFRSASLPLIALRELSTPGQPLLNLDAVRRPDFRKIIEPFRNKWLPRAVIG